MTNPWPETYFSTTVVASPALAAETVVAQVVVPATGPGGGHVLVEAWAAFTVGTAGTAVRLRIRSGGVAGTLIADSGALTGGVAAAALLAQDVEGVDAPAESAGLVYVLTLQVTAATAASAVSATRIVATVVP